MRGSVTKKGNKYYGIYDIGRDANGKRIQKWTKGFDLKKETQFQKSCKPLKWCKI